MLPVYVMIGGRSSRFGQNKATYPVEGEPWALHVGRRLANGGELVLVGGDPPQPPLAGCGWAPDARSTSGPLAGLLAALSDRQHRFGDGLLVLAACDLVRPQASWLDGLVATHADRPGLEAAAYRAADRWQPYPSVAHTRWLPRLEQAIAEGARSLQAALDAAQHAALPWPGDGAGPPQANTPEELAQLLVGKN